MACWHSRTPPARTGHYAALLARGYLYKEIAEKLKISIPTVNAHIRNMYEKLHVHSRSQAVAKYLGT